MQHDYLQTKYDPETFKYHPMYHVWCMDMKKSFLEALKVHPKTSNFYDSFAERVHGQSGFTVLSIGDQEFGERWKMISSCLAELYIKVRWMLAKYGCEAHMGEMYREKYEQALDWLTGDKQEVPPLLKCGLTKKITNDDIDKIASLVLQKRSLWLDQLYQIEHIRLTAKREILQGQYCSNIHTVMLNAIDLLTKLDQSWT